MKDLYTLENGICNHCWHWRYWCCCCLEFWSISHFTRTTFVPARACVSFSWLWQVQSTRLGSEGLAIYMLCYTTIYHPLQSTPMPFGSGYLELLCSGTCYTAELYIEIASRLSECNACEMHFSDIQCTWLRSNWIIQYQRLQAKRLSACNSLPTTVIHGRCTHSDCA